MSYMFYGASAFNQDIGSLNTGNVTNMARMFAYASAFNQDIGGWNTGKWPDLGTCSSAPAPSTRHIRRLEREQLTILAGMFTDAQLSTRNYDALLQGWTRQIMLQFGVMFDAGNSQYCLGEAARSHMIFDGRIRSGEQTPACGILPSPTTFVITVKTDNPDLHEHPIHHPDHRQRLQL